MFLIFLQEEMDTTNAGIYLEIPDTEVNFLLDAASAVELPHNPHWLSDATHRIDTLRKAPVSFKWVKHIMG